MRRKLVWLLAAALVLPAALVAADEPIPPSNTSDSTAALFREARISTSTRSTSWSSPVQQVFLQFDMPKHHVGRLPGGPRPARGPIQIGAYYGGSNALVPLLGSGNSTEQAKTTTYSLDR